MDYRFIRIVVRNFRRLCDAGHPRLSDIFRFGNRLRPFRKIRFLRGPVRMLRIRLRPRTLFPIRFLFRLIPLLRNPIQLPIQSILIPIPPTKKIIGRISIESKNIIHSKTQLHRFPDGAVFYSFRKDITFRPSFCSLPNALSKPLPFPCRVLLPKRVRSFSGKRNGLRPVRMPDNLPWDLWNRA